ncbi:MAG TPA: hypothetical protein VN922_05755, partial [Bacteroidia bacterium]|nr:hypothetical protein [Bacteroidia bacterium]
MKKTYPLHFLLLRKCYNHLVILFVLVFVGAALGVNAQFQAIPPQNPNANHAQRVSGGVQSVVPQKETTSGMSTNSAKSLTNTTAQAEGNGNKVPRLTSKWIAHPFDAQIFIENKGQYDKDLDNKEKVLFHVHLNTAIKMYFLPNGLIFKHSEFVSEAGDKDDADADEGDKGKGIKGEREDRDKPHTEVVTKLSTVWEGANTNVVILAGDEQQGVHTCSMGKGMPTISSNAFKKLTYKNLYPGIDVVYTFPAKGEKGDIKYTLIVHPGADLSQVKLNYTNAKSLAVDSKGDLHIQNDIHELIEYAPVSSYQEGGNVNVAYKIDGNTESFEVKGDYDKTKTLVIDPLWGINFGGGYSSGYDLDYDNFGNVFVGGAYDPYVVEKYNSAGTLIYAWSCFVG